MRLTVEMSKGWAWTGWIVSAVGLALTIIFFIASQEIGGRDWVAWGVGFVLGSGASAIVAALTNGSRKQAAQPDPIRLKKIELMESLQTRAERLKELREEIASHRIEIAAADGNFKVGMIQAGDARQMGLADIALENSSAA